MKRFGARNYALIVQGVKMMGTFDPTQIFAAFYEELFVSESDEIYNFLAWVHAEGKCFGHGNYEEVFSEFKACNPQPVC